MGPLYATAAASGLLVVKVAFEFAWVLYNGGCAMPHESTAATVRETSRHASDAAESYRPLRRLMRSTCSLYVLVSILESIHPLS
jgi:hypothetical protein